MWNSPQIIITKIGEKSKSDQIKHQEMHSMTYLECLLSGNVNLKIFTIFELKVNGKKKKKKVLIAKW